jgi:hypothetical protein
LIYSSLFFDIYLDFCFHSLTNDFSSYPSNTPKTNSHFLSSIIHPCSSQQIPTPPQIIQDANFQQQSQWTPWNEQSYMYVNSIWWIAQSRRRIEYYCQEMCQEFFFWLHRLKRKWRILFHLSRLFTCTSMISSFFNAK